MRADIAIILDRLKKTLGQLPQIKAFVFGSAVQTNSPLNDIDILVIYMDPALLSKTDFTGPVISEYHGPVITEINGPKFRIIFGGRWANFSLDQAC